ncbi:alpha/beta-hydrolase [Mycena crocata]|nr:alpha/beta-hydrolase [Mycena crocata]
MAFRFHTQPQKAVYLVFGVAYLIIRLPFWTIRNLLPPCRPRKKWSLGRALLVEIINAGTQIMLSTSIPAPPSLEKLGESIDETGFVWVQPSPELIVGDIQHFAEKNGVTSALTGGFWYGANGQGNSVGQRAAAEEKVIFHLHGGGFIMGSGSPSFPPTMTTIKGFRQHFPQIPRIFALEYRLASGAPFPSCNPFPAALIDVIAGYSYLLEIGVAPQNVIISGDSAGGILAYQLARHLASTKVLPQAGALLLLSPSADSGLRALPGSSMRTNRRADYVRTWFDAGYVPPTLCGMLPAAELDRAWLSPGSPVLADSETAGLFTGFPRTFILAGEAEMSRDSMRVLRDRMRTDMGDEMVEYVEVADAPHDFVGMTMFEPERTVGLAAIAEWVCTL